MLRLTRVCASPATVCRVMPLPLTGAARAGRAGGCTVISRSLSPLPAVSGAHGALDTRRHLSSLSSVLLTPSSASSGAGDAGAGDGTSEGPGGAGSTNSIRPTSKDTLVATFLLENHSDELPEIARFVLTSYLRRWSDKPSVQSKQLAEALGKYHKRQAQEKAAQSKDNSFTPESDLRDFYQKQVFIRDQLDGKLGNLETAWNEIKRIAQKEIEIYNFLFGVNPPYPGAFMDLPDEVVAQRLKYFFPTMLKPPTPSQSTKKREHGMKDEEFDRPGSLAHFTGTPEVLDKLYELDAICDQLESAVLPPLAAAHRFHDFCGSLLTANLFAAEGQRVNRNESDGIIKDRTLLNFLSFRMGFNDAVLARMASNEEIGGLVRAFFGPSASVPSTGDQQTASASASASEAVQEQAGATKDASNVLKSQREVVALLKYLFLAPGALEPKDEFVRELNVLRARIIAVSKAPSSPIEQNLRAADIAAENSSLVSMNPFLLLDQGSLTEDPDFNSQQTKLTHIIESVLLGNAKSAVLPSSPTLFDILQTVAHRLTYYFPAFEASPTITPNGQITFDAARWHIRQKIGPEAAAYFEQNADLFSLVVSSEPTPAWLNSSEYQKPVDMLKMKRDRIPFPGGKLSFNPQSRDGRKYIASLQQVISATPLGVIGRPRLPLSVSSWHNRETFEQMINVSLSESQYRRILGKLSKIARLPNAHLVASYLDKHRRHAEATKQLKFVPSPLEENKTTISGRRKNAVAVTVMERAFTGNGGVTVNGKALVDHFPRVSDRYQVLMPLYLTGTTGFFNITCTVKGGGLSGQAGAIQESLTHGLLRFYPHFKKLFRVTHMVTKDRRMVEPKKPGRRKARRKFQWVKR